MAPSTRWDPARERLSLRDAMNQLIEQAVTYPGLGSLGMPLGGSVGGSLGQINVLEAEGRYLCQVLLPGVTPEDLELTLRQNTLTLTAKLLDLFPEEVRKQGTYLLQEFGGGEFSRSVVFPKEVDGDAIEAHFDRGILMIELPIAAHAQPKRITIHAGNEAPPKTRYVEEATAPQQGNHKEIKELAESEPRTNRRGPSAASA